MYFDKETTTCEHWRVERKRYRAGLRSTRTRRKRGMREEVWVGEER
jgi:hypothetical protein